MKKHLLGFAPIALGAVLACASPDTTPGSDSGQPAGSDVATTPPATTTDTGAPSAPPSDGPNALVLTADGWGPLRIGMTRAQVIAAAGPDANPNAVGGPDPESCDQFRPRNAPDGLLVMVERDTLTRITLSRNTGIRTDRGFQVGDSASKVLAAYGSAITAMPHKYSNPPARYLTVWKQAPPAPNARGIVYEIGMDDRIMHIHGGGPSIRYVEGCL